MGSPYVGTGGGGNNTYGAMFAADRNVARPYLSVRYCEANTFGPWLTWRQVMPMLQDLTVAHNSHQLEQMTLRLMLDKYS